MKLGFRIALIVGCAGLAWTSQDTSAQTVSKCRPADAKTANIIGHLKRWITRTEPDEIRLRDSVFKIPVVDVAQINVVTDERVCANAIKGYGALPGNRTPASLYVIKMGTKFFAVYDPSDKADDLAIVYIMDSKFLPVGGYSGA